MIFGSFFVCFFDLMGVVFFCGDLFMVGVDYVVWFFDVLVVIFFEL